MINIIYMGTPDYASTILEKLLQDDDINVLSVYTQPDKPVGRKKILTAPITKVVALSNNIKVYQPSNLRSDETQKEIKDLKPDYIVVAAYGQILPKNILDIAPCINLHASILPQYRGASPIQQSLLNGDRETGVTAMLMDVGLDTGDILKTSKINIPKDMMVATLFEELTRVASDLTLDVLKNFKTFIPKKQDDEAATHCSKISKENGLIVFDDALNLYNKYRAFTPWPGVYLESGLKLKEMSLESIEGEHTQGEVLEMSKKSIVIGCSKGSLRLTRLQPPSKKEMDVSSYLNGKRLERADTLV
ncbi:methionyl-tRNA formyltransferase [Sulfurimonas sp. MAG313]|nr:methionyl-tRNA formyltransferase [Sulfurimonas sp. MAG313]MDF1880516.1 methionyl-tRNA formyltransferase [Sulfurimonas sp. MAG313]